MNTTIVRVFSTFLIPCYHEPMMWQPNLSIWICFLWVLYPTDWYAVISHLSTPLSFTLCIVKVHPHVSGIYLFLQLNFMSQSHMLNTIVLQKQSSAFQDDEECYGHFMHPLIGTYVYDCFQYIFRSRNIWECGNNV